MKDQKVFGIGLSRTGTSSLNEALEILGYRSIHFPIIMKNTSTKAMIKYRLNRWIGEVGFKTPLFTDFVVGTRNTIQYSEPEATSFDSLTDTPVARFFRELDHSYPNSKFILTIRDEPEWLNSCSKFFAEGKNQFFKWMQVNVDLYGSNTFDQARFKSGYNKHIKEVKDHFRSRPEDLLILDITSGDGWDKLCPFLEIDIPIEPFPRKNQST